MTEEKKFEEMTLDEYRSIIKYGERDKYLEEVNRKVASGEITTEEELSRACLVDLRVNTTPAKVGNVHPILRYSKGRPGKIGNTEIPTIDVDVIQIRIIE